MLKTKKNCLRIALFLSILIGRFSLPCLADTETLQIDTYYPAPYGIYSELRAQRMALGEDYINSPYQWGSTIDDNIDLLVQGGVYIRPKDTNFPYNSKYMLHVYTDVPGIKSKEPSTQRGGSHEFPCY